MRTRITITASDTAEMTLGRVNTLATAADLWIAALAIIYSTGHKPVWWAWVFLVCEIVAILIRMVKEQKQREQAQK